MEMNISGLIIGILFGAALQLGGLAEPDKIIGTLRLKDFHAMRTIAVFVLVGMFGMWILELTGHANFSVKNAQIVSVLIGGALLGIGFGATGFCPGTGLACAATGRLDALVTVLGMFAGAAVYIYFYDTLAVPLGKIADYGKVTIPEITKTNRALWVIPITVIGIVTLALTAPKKKEEKTAE